MFNNNTSKVVEQAAYVLAEHACDGLGHAPPVGTRGPKGKFIDQIGISVGFSFTVSLSLRVLIKSALLSLNHLIFMIFQ
jgi:hypothetical protein